VLLILKKKIGDWQVSHGKKISEKDKTIADLPKK
jgi:hypothetical protein